jgi:hypothetical protein
MADGISMAIGSAVLKQIYSDGVNRQINDETPALGGIKSTAKNITNVGGAGVAFEAHFGRNHGIGARNELEPLPTAGQQVYAKGTTGLKSLYGTIQVTAHTMKQAKSNPQAFIDYVSEEMSRVKPDLAKDQNRQVYGDGTGTLAKVKTAAGSSTTWTLDDVRYLSAGMRIDLLQVATLGAGTPTPTNTSGYLTIVSVNEGANTIVVSAAAVTVVGDVLVRSSRTSASLGVNSWKKEWSGYGTLISDTGDLFGISLASFPDWKSVVKVPVAGDGTLTELDLDGVVLDVRRKGSKPTRILTTPGVYRAYWQALQGMRQYVNKTDLNGGLGELAFSTPYGNIPITTDFDCPKGVAWFPNEKEIELLR